MIITGKYPQLRLRRNRKQAWTRRLLEETNLSCNDLIMPIFVMEGKNKIQTIKNMPGIKRYSINNLGKIVDKAIKNGIPMVSIFPYTNQKLNNLKGSASLNEDNLVCKSIRYIKDRYKNQIGIMTDVALDPYTSHGHDGILENNYVNNDKTVEILCKQSLLQAQMGCDVIAPSDMMDGRVGQIRKILDKNNLELVQILSYAVKFASNYYGPFREAIGSRKNLKNDKKDYQMDYKNKKEALREVSLDIKEGADIVMVKPGLPYLDIISSIKKEFKIPVFAYQVSGEYSLIMNGIKRKIIKDDAILESLISFKRAGCSAIVTYFAYQLASMLK